MTGRIDKGEADGVGVRATLSIKCLDKVFEYLRGTRDTRLREIEIDRDK